VCNDNIARQVVPHIRLYRYVYYNIHFQPKLYNNTIITIMRPPTFLAENIFRRRARHARRPHTPELTYLFVFRAGPAGGFFSGVGGFLREAVGGAGR